jgi:2-polyprenyl-3-methyl-5-hydroxy-6-metoxy-1,4-benzoquinol methylase
MSTRDYNQEFRDNSRKYAYEFDDVLRRYVLRSLDPFLRAGKALEMGCYRGDTTVLLAARFADLTVIEASDELVAVARARVSPAVRFIHATFETVDLRERFDSVFLLHALEHLDDPIAVLKRTGSWMAPGGRLFVVVPNANAPSRQIAVYMGLIEHNAAVTDAEREHGHRRTYALDTLERDVTGAGLRVVHRGGVFFKPLANYQFDKLLGTDIITDEFLEGCYRLGERYPDLCASVYVVCERVQSQSGVQA